MSSVDWLILGGVLALFLFSVFLAVAETAFVRMSRIRALTLADEGDKRAARLAVMLEQPEQTLNSVLLLVLISQLTSASLLGILLERQFGPLGVVVGLVLQIVVFFVIGEVAPKTYAVQHTDRAALGCSGFLYAISAFPPMRILSRGLIGVANVLLPGRGLKRGPFVTEEEIRTMADVAAAEEAIEHEESRLIHSIFEFGDTVVREVMVPRPDMVGIDSDATIAEAMERAIERGFSRLPAYQGDMDHVVGLVYLKDLVRLRGAGEGDRSLRGVLRDVLREAKFVPEQKRVAELLREMQSQKFHMAIVVDEHGGTAGLVTLEDLLEEIVGEITDEYDEETPGVEHLDATTLRVPGRLDIDELNDVLGIELPSTEWDTVGGLVFNLLGKVPAEGEIVHFQGLDLETERVQGSRIVSVLIRRRAPVAAAATGAGALERAGDDGGPTQVADVSPRA
jgi:CBS domain containing-hemolysin-like protein